MPNGSRRPKIDDPSAHLKNPGVERDVAGMAYAEIGGLDQNRVGAKMFHVRTGFLRKLSRFSTAKAHLKTVPSSKGLPAI